MGVYMYIHKYTDYVLMGSYTVNPKFKVGFIFLLLLLIWFGFCCTKN
jgi:hypothetical protein